MTEYLMVAFVLILSLIGHNMTVVYAAVIVLAVKILSQITSTPIMLDWRITGGISAPKKEKTNLIVYCILMNVSNCVLNLI